MRNRRYYVYKDTIGAHFFEYRWYYLSFGFFIVLGIFCGFFRAGSIKTTLTVDILQLGYIRNFLAGNSSPVAFFFSHFFSNLVILAVVFALTIWIYSFPVAYVVIFYRGYLLGLNFLIISTLLGAGSSILLWVIIFPLELLIMGFLCSLTVYCSHRCVYFYRFGHYDCGNYYWLLKKAWVHLIILLAVFIIEFIFIKFFANSFILIL